MKTRLSCAGCGAVVPDDDPAPFRCPARRPTDGNENGNDDDIDHVLRREFIDPPASAAGFAGREENPFVRYRERLRSHELFLASGRDDADYVALVDRLDTAVARVWGHGFAATPFSPSAVLGALVKDETGNVAGSHKARHLFGVLLHLESMNLPRATPLAIASCGNAALAAAVLARAADRPLQVFIPPWTHPTVQRRLAELGAHLVLCPREDGTPGDPCYHRFRAAVQHGAVPFCCQGSDNGLTIEGGETLAYELVSSGQVFDHLFIQVGGGALASACVQALSEAVAAGVLPKLPRIHAVQTEGAAPLARAYARVRAAVESSLSIDERRSAPLRAIGDALHRAARHRSAHMWPWETEPRSIADGILDDETYDWLEIVGGMLRSGGGPVIVTEDRLREANALTQEAGIAASFTGSAGVAGLLTLRAQGALAPHERAAVLVTGVRR